MAYDDIVMCPCRKTWVPKGFEHQCPHCKGKRTVKDLWAEMCAASPDWPVDLTTPTNSKPRPWTLTPKETPLNQVYDEVLGTPSPKVLTPAKECIRINLPPKPKDVPTIKLPPSRTPRTPAERMQDEFEMFFSDASKSDVEEQRRKDDLAAREAEKAFNETARKQTLVVNLFAGPGAGKSTTAAGLFFELKSRGINCELAAEYAKDLTWEERHRTFENQVYIFGKQHHRIYRLLGQVDVVIADSPLLLTVVYDGDKRDSLKELVYEEHRKMWTYNAFIKRVKPFNPKGRIHGFDEAQALDNKILDALDDAGECYEVFDGTPEGKDKLVKKVLFTLEWHKTCTALKR